MKKKYKDLYIDWAKRTAELSHARRLKVGAVIVKNDTVISYGYNGMPVGFDNNCEIEEKTHNIRDIKNSNEWKYNDVEKYYFRLKTRQEVIHAEMNALLKLAKSTNSSENSDMFVTHAPCVNCAKLICQSGIKRVFYTEDYRDDEGITLLKKSKIGVYKI